MRGRGLVAGGVLVCAGVAAACTDGTTPDCSDAQCLPIIVVDAQVVEGGDAGPVPDSAPDSVTDSATDGAGRAPSDGSVDSGDSTSPDVRDAGGGD
jgi:hypothetical protein